MITGLLGNALGLDHSESGRLSSLQSSLRFASRQDRKGKVIEDYHTTDLSQDHMSDDRAWTTSGKPMSRRGTVADSTHVSTREYIADACYTVAVGTDDPPEWAEPKRLASALEKPARPLFIGRKACPPSHPLLVDVLEPRPLLMALAESRLPPRAEDRDQYSVRMLLSAQNSSPETPPSFTEEMRQPRSGRKDWTNHVHSGQVWVLDGHLSLNKPSVYDE
jgi:CRISPR system Cascade subunit CasD